MQISRSSLRRLAGLGVLAAAIVVSLPVRGADKRIVLIAGKPSHPHGEHEFRAGCLLMQKALTGFPGISVQVYDGGWPSKIVDDTRVDDNGALDNADAVLIYADGGRGNPAIQGDRMPWRRFLFFNVAGGVVWASVFGIGAYVAGEQFARLEGPLAVAGLVLGGIAFGLTLRFVRRHETALLARAERALQEVPAEDDRD